jgi:hypothetical protein
VELFFLDFFYQEKKRERIARPLGHAQNKKKTKLSFEDELEIKYRIENHLVSKLLSN